MNATMKYCVRCIMPESYPGVYFNDEGVCNYCIGYKSFHKPLGKERLLELLTSQPRTGKYDCVVPISGGKDSTYILYYVVKKLGLKPIAVTYDSGFQSSIALENARNACSVLNVPLIEVKSPKHIRTKMLKESLLVSNKLGALWHQCGNCEAILRNMSMSAAKTHETHFVIWGSSALESGDSKTYEWYKQSGSPHGISPVGILRKAISKIRVLLNTPKRIYEIPRKVYSYVGYHAIKYYYYSISERLSLDFSYRYAFKPHAIPPFDGENPKFVHFFDYIDWDSINNLETLKREVNWKHPAGQDSRWDCAIHCLSNRESLKSYGISDDGKNYCNFIREHKVDREEAMKNEVHLRESVEPECEELFQRIGFDDHKTP
jgi:hypothetical protein